MSGLGDIDKSVTVGEYYFGLELKSIIMIAQDEQIQNTPLFKGSNFATELKQELSRICSFRHSICFIVLFPSSSCFYQL